MIYSCFWMHSKHFLTYILPLNTVELFIFMKYSGLFRNKCKNIAVSNSLYNYSVHVIVFQNPTLPDSHASVTFLDDWSFICAAAKVKNSDLNPSRRLCALLCEMETPSDEQE